MKSLFNKKAKEVKAAPVTPTETLQELQNEFNKVVFHIGDLTYRKRMFGEEIARLNDEINTLSQKADTLGRRAKAAHEKIQSEISAKVKEGEGNVPKVD